MNTLINNSKNYISFNRKKYIFILSIIIVGIITGIFFIVFISNKDKSLIKDNITLVIDTINKKKINYLDTFLNSISKNLLSLIGIYILGISIIGVPLIILFLFIKGFTIGFSISSFIYIYHIKGLFISFLYLTPSDLILLIIYILFGLKAINFSIKLFRYLFLKENISLNKYFKVYNKCFLICLIFILLISILETFLIPFIIDLCV